MFLTSLGAAVAVTFGLRLLLPLLPLRGQSRTLSATQAALGAVGLAGLTLHCGAMFFRRAVELIPWSDTVSGDIRALGIPSVIWYVVPALFVLAALAGQHRAARAVVALGLTGVGVTMYDGGSLRAHLVAIFLSVLALAVVVATVVIPPWRQSPVPACAAP